MRPLLLVISVLIASAYASAQSTPLSPSLISSGVFLGETQPLRDMLKLTEEDYSAMAVKAAEEAKEGWLNKALQFRSYPFASIALPKGLDPVWQRSMGKSPSTGGVIANFEGQVSPYYPPDCNGTAGPNHFMQTVNTSYTIYDKSGAVVAGPSNMNTLFNGVPGSNCNDGDPLILYDDEADRWLAVEFSLCGSTDLMLVAVSTTNDPTGSWYKYSFDVADMPDYEKFGIWQDGYYMGSNNSSGNDIYVFERSQMLIGATSPQMIGFNNAWRPTSVDGFMCVPPVDNDGQLAPAGTPGMFIAFNDDAIGGGSDELWIYELAADWTTPSASTFNRTQQIAVAPFDCNFGNNWDNIKQQGTNQELDGIPQVIMNVPQYRNFGSYQTLVCCHTVDVDNTDHAGVRWYELRKTAGPWTVRQQGTYAPDANSRWMGSIMLNGHNELGLGYSISSSSMYPSIRFCGQTAANYEAANGILDYPEGIIQTGTTAQTGANRWGDYSLLSIDPSDNETFWFTSEYIGGGGSRKSKIASFQIGIIAPVSEFTASTTLPCIDNTVVFTDQSSGQPTFWRWAITPNSIEYVDGTDSTSQNPHVKFLSFGDYTVSLKSINAGGNHTVTKTGYISVNPVNPDFNANSTTVMVGSSTIFTDASTCDIQSYLWNFGDGASPATANTPGPHVVTYSTAGLKTVTLTLNDSIVMAKTDYINVIDQTVTMSNLTVSACSGNFVDPGGSGSNYTSNLDYTLVLNPGIPGNQVRVIFNSFHLEPQMFCANDYLRIFNGSSVQAPIVGVYCGTSILDTITASNADGALTFVFHSNNIINFQGWDASIDCIQGIANPLLFSATAMSESQIDLSWMPNVQGNGAMIVWSQDGNFGIPVNGISYSAGDLVPGGGTVLYSGNASSFNHSLLEPATLYHYRAFSFDASLIWSFGVNASATTLSAATLAITPLSQTVTYSPGTTTFAVSSNSDWTAISDAGWCSVTSSGTGNGTITAVFDENTSPVARLASITVEVSGLNPQSLQVIQLPSFVSVPENSATGIALYPNPNSGIFTISSAANKVVDMSIKVYNELGSVVLSKECKGSSGYSFDFTGFPKGPYYVEAMNGGKIVKWKMVLK